MTQIASIVYRPIGQPNPKDDYLRLDLDDANLIAGYGIEGDAKGGHPDRQLNVMSYETLTILRGQGFYTEPGQMGEQIVIHQLDVDALPAGAKVQLGNEAIIEIVKPRTGCEKFETVQKRSRSLVQGQMGMIARVIVGGKIHIGDPVRVLKEVRHQPVAEIVMTPIIGILHPGAMGLSVAASARNSGCTVYWASEGRSPQTAERAARIGLPDAHSLADLCRTCSVIFSVCPPAAAEAQANDVLSLGFKGLYVDMNAIAPQRVQRIAEKMAAHGTRFVSGSIIGGPAWQPNSTWLYLSGEDAQSVADCFTAGPLETQVLGDDITKATALKMCFAAYTKGTTALLAAVMAAAEALDVRADLERQWSRNGSTFAEESARNVQQVTAKAWRFSGEMEEIASTLGDAGLPAEFHLAAADIYQRMAGFKGADPLPSLEQILSALIQKPADTTSLKTND